MCRVAVVILGLTLAWMACAPPPPPREAEISAAGVEADLKKFAEAWEREDLEAAAAAFAPDAVVFDPVPPGRFEGPDGVRAWISGSFQALDRIAIDLSQIRVQTAGPIAWVTARYVFEARQEGKPLRVEGHMSVVFVLQTDGSGKMSVFHASHLPAAERG